MVDVTVIIVGLVIVFIASIVQGATGFGFALTSMPLLAIFIPLDVVVPIMVIFSLITNVLILVKLWSYVRIKKIWLLIVASSVSAPFGTYLLLIIEERVLKITVGLLIILFALVLWKGYSFTIKREKLALIPVGFLGGLLNGSLSLSGPPVVLFLTNQKEDKTIFRANITTYALILNVMTIIFFIMGGLIIKQVFSYMFWYFPALIIATFIGVKIGNKVEQALFKKITLLLIIISGFSAIVSAIF